MEPYCSTSIYLFTLFYFFILICKFLMLRTAYLPVDTYYDIRAFSNLFYPHDFEILGWCSVGPVLPQGEKVPLQPWLAILLVMVSR